VNDSEIYTFVKGPVVHATGTPAGAKLTHEQIEAIVAESIATTLGHENSELDPERSFADYGVDSIVLVELVTSLNSRLGIELKPTALFDNPNLRELSTFISGEFGTALKLLPNGSTTQQAGSKGPDVEIEILEQLAHGSLTLEETYSRLRQTGG
jgi:acyl carrier protein